MSGTDGRIGDHPLDDLAAYALHALDDTEREAIDDHLSQCVACRDDLATHHETLALLAPVEAPPAAVWERIAASIEAPDVPAPVTRLPERKPFRLGVVAAAASVAVALAMGGLVGFALGSSGGATDIGGLAERASEQPGGERAALVSAGGETVARVVADEDGAYLVLDGLENLPEGRAYQLWSLTGSQPVSLGMLGRDGTNTVAFRLPPSITELAISEAPTNGDAAPAGQFLASGTVTPS